MTEKEPEKTSQEPQSVNLPLEVLKQVLEEVKKPYVDPEIATRKAAAKARLRREREIQLRNEKATQDACPHLREDNTSAVAWMQNSDGVTRGCCQRCNKLFTPDDPDYARMLRIPTRSGNVISYL